MASFGDLVVPLLNHLLEHERWASGRLAPFAGQVACISGGPLELKLTITDSGFFRTAGAEEEANVTIALPSDAPFRLLSDPRALFGAARLSGAANFAEALAFVFRNLRWDYEADLAALIGDIPARRLAQALAAGLVWQRSTVARLRANLVEFASEEADIVTPARDLTQFAHSVDQLRDDVARLEKRLSRLSG